MGRRWPLGLDRGPSGRTGGLLFSLLFRTRQSVLHKREKRSKREKRRFLGSVGVRGWRFVTRVGFRVPCRYAWEEPYPRGPMTELASASTSLSRLRWRWSGAGYLCLGPRFVGWGCGARSGACLLSGFSRRTGLKGFSKYLCLWQIHFENLYICRMRP